MTQVVIPDMLVTVFTYMLWLYCFNQGLGIVHKAILSFTAWKSAKSSLEIGKQIKLAADKLHTATEKL